MKKTTIYGLYSTRDNIIRYVGKSNNPKTRLKDHIWSSKRKINNTYKSCWIRKELNDGFNILYKVLEVCDMESWPEIEQKYIKNIDNLTNHHKGGLGGSPIQYNKSYKELKDWVIINLPERINTAKKWKEYIKFNYKNILPLTPNKIYKDSGWVDWATFLNTTNHKNRKYVSYIEFKDWVVKNKIKTSTEFKKIKKPYNITSTPNLIYDKDWIGWCDVFNYKIISKDDYWSYDEAKNYLNINYNSITVSRFRELCKNNDLPTNIPKKPERFYKNFTYKDFLKSNYVEFLSFNDAKDIVHTFKLKTNKEWRLFIKTGKLPLNIPKTPSEVYKNEWVSWYDWLGNKKGD